MNLDELRSVQSKERSKDSLQHLRETFYSDVADYIADLRAERERAAEQADNALDDPEVNRLTDEIRTAEEVVEAVYERRVGKVVKRASLAAAGMPADQEGLTSEEQRLFSQLVERIESNKAQVLDVLAGESDDVTTDESAVADAAGGSAGASATDSTPAPGDAPVPSEGVESADKDVSAADLMGGSADAATDSGVGVPPTEAAATDESPLGTADESGTQSESATDQSDDSRPTAEAAAVADGQPDDDSDSIDDSGPDESGDSDSENPLAGLDARTTVRVTTDVGEIFGVDERTYELASEDVVTLPEANAEPLVERGAAEKLE